MAWVHLHNIISEAFSNMWRTPQHSFCSVSSLKHISMCTCFYWSPCPMCFLCCDSFLARSCGLRFFYGTHVHFYLVFWCLHAVAIKHLWLLIAEHTNMLTVILYSVTHFCISVKLHKDPFGLFVWVLYQPFILDWLLNNENNKLKMHIAGVKCPQHPQHTKTFYWILFLIYQPGNLDFRLCMQIVIICRFLQIFCF